MSRLTKVLYVEDEPFLARIVQESLESREFSVRLVTDGEAAISAFDEFKPHICVLDVMLPFKDGFSLAKEIKAKNNEMPIIFLTAKVQTEDLLKGFASGGNDYLRKPFSMEELIVRIHNLLSITSNNRANQKKNGPQEIRLGKFGLFPELQELHLDGNVKKLSQRETQLIQMLTADLNKPVLRKHILLSLWGDDSFYNSRNLDVYISKLRDYFSEDPNIEIVTKKGVGYHFVIRQS
jgi:DNA-binding response OmpR family regulator